VAIGDGGKRQPTCFIVNAWTYIRSSVSSMSRAVQGRAILDPSAENWKWGDITTVSSLHL